MTCCGETFTNYGWDFFMWFCRFWGIITALSEYKTVETCLSLDKLDHATVFYF